MKLEDTKYGAEIDAAGREIIEKEAPEIDAEWQIWLDNQKDPGNYDSYKIKSGPMRGEWVTDVLMPKDLLAKLPPEVLEKL